jgi:hypothetical protein
MFWAKHASWTSPTGHTLPSCAKARLLRFYRRTVPPWRRSRKDGPQCLDVWRLYSLWHIRSKWVHNSVLTHSLVLCPSGRPPRAF